MVITFDLTSWHCAESSFRIVTFSRCDLGVSAVNLNNDHRRGSRQETSYIIDLVLCFRDFYAWCLVLVLSDSIFMFWCLIFHIELIVIDFTDPTVSELGQVSPKMLDSSHYILPFLRFHTWCTSQDLWRIMFVEDYSCGAHHQTVHDLWTVLESLILKLSSP